MSKIIAPKYEQAYRVIVEQLKAGRYSIGGRMPTESELSDSFKVSRVTIRRTLDMLVQNGYVERKQGSGYKVLTLSPASDTCLTSFTDAILSTGQEPSSRLISIEQIEPDSSTSQHLPEPLRLRPLTRISRLRMVDEVPRMLVETYAPRELMIDATARDFPEYGSGQSMLRILSGRFGVEWSTACEDISPVAATGAMVAALDVPEGLPLLKQSCSAFDTNGEVVFHEDVFRNGSVKFDLTRQSRIPRHA